MPAETGRFVVRAYQPGDEHAILDLFARSFHLPQSLAQWRWKYQQDPAGRERISVAFEGDRLVGHYAGYPVRFVLDGQRIEANQIGDTMTDVSVRHIGRGPSSVLGQTALHFYEHFCEGRVAFNYGFNVANIQKFSLRFLRSDRVEPVAYRSRDLRKNPFRKLSRVERWSRGLRFQLVRTTSEEWDAFFERVAPRYGFLSQRDAAYVRWRYLQSSAVAYHVVAIRKWRTLVGWIAFRIREGRFSLGDMLVHPDHGGALEAVLRHLSFIFSTDTIETWCPPRPEFLDAILRNLGLEAGPEPQDLSVMCVPFMRMDAVGTMRSRLFYTMGDSDLF